MESQATTTQNEAVPSAWPGAFKLYKYARDATRVNWQAYLALIVIGILISVVAGMVGGSDKTAPQYLITQLLSFIASAYISVASTIVELRNVQREKISASDSLSQSGSHFLGMLGLMLLLWVVLSLSLLLFVIPFFFVLPRLVLSPYYLVNQNLGPIAALKASWEKTKGHSGKVWGIIGVNILFVLLCVTIIGIPVALYLLFMYASASPVLYYWINRQSTQPAVAAAPTPVQ